MVVVGDVSISADSNEDVDIVDTMEVSAFLESNRERHTAPGSPMDSSFAGVTRDDQDSSEVYVMGSSYYLTFVPGLYVVQRLFVPDSNDWRND